MQIFPHFRKLSISTHIAVELTAHNTSVSHPQKSYICMIQTYDTLVLQKSYICTKSLHTPYPFYHCELRFAPSRRRIYRLFPYPQYPLFALRIQKASDEPTHLMLSGGEKTYIFQRLKPSGSCSPLPGVMPKYTWHPCLAGGKYHFCMSKSPNISNSTNTSGKMLIFL